MGKIFYGWWIVLASFLVALYVGGAVWFAFTAFFEPIVEEFGWSYTQVSIAFSLRGLEMGILSPIIGFLVDRFGSRKLSLCGVITTGLALILLSLTNSLVMFYGAFALLGFGAGGCASTVLMTAVAHWFRKNVGKAMGIVACGFGAGGILVPLVVWLIDLYGWRTALLILGVGMWALGIPLSFVIRHAPEEYGYLPDGEILVTPSSDQGDGGVEKVNFKEAFKNRNFWKIAIGEAIRSMITLTVVTHVMPYLSSIGMARSRAALVATAIPLFSVIGRFGFGWLSDIFDKRYVLAGIYFIVGVGMLTFSYIQVKWLVFVFLILFSPAYGGAVSLRGAMVREYFGRASFGRLLGTMMGIMAIGGIAGQPAAGWVFDNVGSYEPVWLVFAGGSFVGAALILRIKSSPPNERPL